mgnify:CR=1 FL=1|tara:strand:- start:1192 stop:1344 length:153 start_codon:yes stop_codon:yes gene_type:complete
MADRYFKKPSGVIIKVIPNFDIKSLIDRFEECDKDGKKLVKKTTKKKGDK